MRQVECIDGPLKGLKVNVTGRMPFVLLESPMDVYNAIRSGAVKIEDIRIETYEFKRIRMPDTYGLVHRGTALPSRPGVR